MPDVYELIKEECLKSEEKDPLKLIVRIMNKSFINMHGPEHHILDGSCLLTALHNAGFEFSLEEALDEMMRRGVKMPGATCGNWGVCGSAASVGAAMAIIHGTGPLCDNQYYKDNMHYVSEALEKIGDVGGPRCCKRNAFISLQTAVDFVNEHYNAGLPKSNIKCSFHEKNKQCKGEACPFFR